MLVAMLTQCKDANRDNPFFSEYTAEFKMPPFDKIKLEHYVPAFEAGIAQQKQEIEVIVACPDAPTFENTILAYQNSGKLLEKVSTVFYALNSANTSPEMQEIARIVSPMTTEHRDNISMNNAFFQRIKSLYDGIGGANYDSLQRRTVEKYYSDFIRNGAGLDDSGKVKLRAINQKLSELTLKFSDNLLAETNKNFRLVVDSEADLSGLPQSIIDAAAMQAAKDSMEGKWVFTLQKPSLIPFLQYSSNRVLREKIYMGYVMRGDHDNKFDNKAIMLDIVNLRAQKAKLLGYNTFAHYAIDINMAKTPEAVYSFLNQIMPAAIATAKRDCKEMQSIIDREGGKFKLAPWDWWYYSEKLKKEKYNLEESEIQPYFLLSNVRDGMFYAANKLYGITFTQRTDLPVYHPEVEVFEVKDEKGEHLSLLTLDYHPRDGKSVGAWCGRLRGMRYENGVKVAPIVTITCNFTRATNQQPALLTWDEVTTLFHEFGHALHGFFTDGQYRRIAGNVPRDMVELPSQVMENWAATPELLNVYAKHYKTGEPMPKELMDRMLKSVAFNEGFVTTEYIAASILDLDLHSFTEPQKVDLREFEKESMKKIGLINEIYPRYRTTYFSHITGGYASGYYVYLWAAVLDTDAYNAFVETGDIYNQEVAAKFRKYILAEGGDDEGMVQYRKFRGKDPSVEPLLKKRGLK